MVKSHEAPKHTVANANEGDVNVLPFRPAGAVSQPKARQLSPTPPVAPVVREG
ncbi:hypothetical protein [Cystobacter ferrugineus]|uniref:hypothetical protein n=1 Tax=Cystobacter ferrugineus TaxID=83449 RepID=UPI000B232F45|nr:hypothetical protein [Cystobacter ferrugineus]